MKPWILILILDHEHFTRSVVLQTKGINQSIEKIMASNKNHNQPQPSHAC